MLAGKLFWCEEDRRTMLALLLENVGAAAAVRLGDPRVWREAVAALDITAEDASMTAPLPRETALIVPVPAAEPVVGRWRRAHDPSAAQGVPAHITLLYPFRAHGGLDDGIYGDLERLFGVAPPIRLTLAGLSSPHEGASATLPEIARTNQAQACTLAMPTSSASPPRPAPATAPSSCSAMPPGRAARTSG